MIGNKNGVVISYDLENYNEKIIPQYQNMSNINIKKKLEIKTDPNIKIMGIKINHKKEILICLSNGSIAIYSHEENYPECINNLFMFSCVRCSYEGGNWHLLG